MSRIWVGTSGYSYKEWRGPFYPPDLPESQMLRYYAQHCSTVEINQTFYRLPTVRAAQSWTKETPEKFLFSLKAPRRITHEMRLRDAADPLTSFCDTAKVLGAKLGAMLFQLPPFLKKDVPRLEDFLHQLPPGFRAAFEFRNPGWFCDEVFECLHRFEVALCVAEHEECEVPFERTAAFGYLRLRRPDYGDEEIAAWARRLRDAAGWQDAFVYFKHEAGGKGPALAARLLALLQPAVQAAAGPA